MEDGKKDESPASAAQVLLNRLDDYLSGREIESYVVGGYVRDRLLSRLPADIDIAVKANAREIASGVAEDFRGTFVLLDEKNDIARVVLNDGNSADVIDFSSFTGSIKADLLRRDFTIDALAVPLKAVREGFGLSDVIDPTGGRKDIENTIIRAVEERVFLFDAVRLLRAVRLAGEFGFTIEPGTEELIREYGHLIFDVPGERIREELLRLTALPHAGQMFRRLDRLGLLTGIFPELEDSRGVEQPGEHYWDVLEHSLAAVEALECILGEGDWVHTSGEVLDHVPLSDVIRQHLAAVISGGSTRKSLLKIAALLHDIGKPSTKAFDETGRMRFLGHSREGAGLVAGMLERLRFSSKEIKVIETAVNHHMRPMQLSQEGMPTNRAIYRYFRDTGETGLDILFLNLADHLAARGPELDIDGWKEHNTLVEYVINKRFEKEDIINPPGIINGYDIMKSLGLEPGPKIGELLEAVREAQVSGEIQDREEALSFVKRVIAAGELPARENDIN